VITKPGEVWSVSADPTARLGATSIHGALGHLRLFTRQIDAEEHAARLDRRREQDDLER
jgi:hypothetical protein